MASTSGVVPTTDAAVDGSTSSSSEPVPEVALADPGAVRVDVYNSAGVDGLAVDVADRMVALGFDVDELWLGGHHDAEAEIYVAARKPPKPG